MKTGTLKTAPSELRLFRNIRRANPVEWTKQIHLKNLDMGLSWGTKRRHWRARPNNPATRWSNLYDVTISHPLSAGRMAANGKLNPLTVLRATWATKARGSVRTCENLDPDDFSTLCPYSLLVIGIPKLIALSYLLLRLSRPVRWSALRRKGTSCSKGMRPCR